MTRSPRPHFLAAVALGGLVLTGCAAEPTDLTKASAPADAGPSGAVWVANEGGDSVTVIDAATGKVRTTLFELAAPHNVQASTSRDVVWVTVTGGVVGLDARGLFPTEVSPAGDHPAHVVEGADGQVYVTAAGDGVLHGFDASLRSPRTVPTGGAPHGMRLTADGKTAVVANTTAGTLDVLDLVAGKKVGAVKVGASPIQVAVTDDGATAFAAVAGTKQVVRVDLATQTVTGTVAVEAAPAQIWLTDSGLLLSANQGTEAEPGDSLSIIDAETMVEQASVVTGSGPHGITVDTSEHWAWVTNAFDDTVTVVDLAAVKATATVPVGDYPNGISYVPTAPNDDAVEETPLVLPHAYSHGEGEAGHGHGETESADPHGDEHGADQEGHGDVHGSEDGGEDAGSDPHGH